MVRRALPANIKAGNWRDTTDTPSLESQSAVYRRFQYFIRPTVLTRAKKKSGYVAVKKNVNFSYSKRTTEKERVRR